MTDREQAERVHDLLLKADRYRMPGHRHTVDRSMEQFDEIRVGLRRLYRELAGGEPPCEVRIRRPTAALFPAGTVPGSRAVVQHRGRSGRSLGRV